MRKPALIEIEDKLKSTGMTETEIDYLMARFLEEEANDYVECMKLVPEYENEELYQA